MKTGSTRPPRYTSATRVWFPRRIAHGLPPQPISEQDLRDLGFGSVVSRESHQRLLNRDGSFNVERKGLGLLASWSPYHVLLTMPWLQFLLLGVASYIVANVVFALAYLACGMNGLISTVPGMIHHPFWRAFFFSVETLSTIGYGNIVPVGYAANIVVTMEALVGLMGFAIATGLVFARFSRPTANVLFSSHAVVAPYHGMQALEFRVANARSNELIEVSAKVIISRFEDAGWHEDAALLSAAAGARRRSLSSLDLDGGASHRRAKPAAGRDPGFVARLNTEVLVLLKAFDETFSTIVQTRTSYTYDDVVWGARFADAFMARCRRALYQA